MRNSTTIDLLIGQNLDSSLMSIAPMNRSIYPIVSHVKSLISVNRNLLEEENTSDSGKHTEERALNRILYISRKANVKDPRDKVYGLLGLLPPSIALDVHPDYDLSEAKVYTRFSELWVRRFNKLDVLFSWCSFNLRSSVPSWSPDWMLPYERNHVHWLKQRRASGDTQPVWSISPDYRHLHCKGFSIGSIRSLSFSPSEVIPYGTERPKTTDITPVDDDLLHHSVYNGKESLASALERTLLQGNPQLHKNAPILKIPWIDWSSSPISTSSILSDLWPKMKLFTDSLSWEAFDQFRQTNAHFSIFGHPFGSFFPEIKSWDGLGLTDINTQSMKLSTLSLIGRRLITTETGFLGLAPEAAERGDFVAIVYGCNFPVVLRPNGDSYWFIGECYIDGIMDGELIEAKEREAYEEKEFTLC